MTLSIITAIMLAAWLIVRPHDGILVAVGFSLLVLANL
jgi:hypothetical protein